jgi:hypothetical protein
MGSFRDDMSEDLKRVFLNGGEFAATATLSPSGAPSYEADVLFFVAGDEQIEAPYPAMQLHIRDWSLMASRDTVEIDGTRYHVVDWHRDPGDDAVTVRLNEER